MTAAAPSEAARRFAARVAPGPRSASTAPRGSEPRVVVNGPATRLLAIDADPLAAATQAVRTSALATSDAVDVLAGEDTDLQDAFAYAREQLDLAARMIAETRLSDLPAFAANPTPVPFEPRTPLGATVLDTPVATSTEAIYGLRVSLRAALSTLTATVRGLGSTPRRGVPTIVVLPWLAEAALVAERIERLADVVVAHVHASRHPGTPELPGVGGDVELYPAGRATPERRFAQRARVRFTPGRVELVTSAGRASVGQESQIGSLLWVAPPPVTAVERLTAPAESDVPGVEHDALGTVHVLDTTGRSLAAIAVADWASQPTTVVDQALVDTTAPDLPVGAARGVFALHSIGFARGAATVGVPMLRGVAHPPAAAGGLGTVRPGPDREPYRGRDLLPTRVAARRRLRHGWRGGDLGPGFPFSGWMRPVTPWLLAVAPLLIWPGAAATRCRSWCWWRR
ncbi:hypothetical protein [Litorihabitans aurantiacus]|uniref:hypothetical protein n=1 Tax=Litorihabitans aurantiacus TaxID=1930061 RepID=UPI0024E073DB|nr:hypothetical protein [Litorihabitans aurantiacus]